ncbi:MAG: prepilin-type N-terminal cleavage/methylation domain-containing protein [Armatimonadetes bacterium]|nr:prepilin-type N-terminal cleavage/methylation domain-containing protein [Armatimonadota bacterium]
MRGLSLLEVLVAFALLTLVAGSVLTVYGGLLAGTRHTDAQLEPLDRFETVCDLFEYRTREDWPAGPATDDVPVVVEGTVDQYAYRVDDLGRLPNPVAAGEYLEVKRLVVRLDYPQQNRNGQTETRSYATTIHVFR